MIAALTGLSGCRMGANDSSQYYDIDPDGWRYGDTLKYVFEPRDTAMTGDLTLSLRHTNDYIYSNIFLEITVTDSIVTRRDTLDITLADDFGRWQLRRPVSIGVRHIMRDEVLNDVEQVGVSFVENK